MVFLLLSAGCAPVPVDETSGGKATVSSSDDAGTLDLSLLVATDMPCVWPVGMQQYVRIASHRIGPGAYNRDLVVIDEHTGTQWDAPAHFVPPPNSGLPNAGPTGVLTAEKVPISQFVGEACVVDLREHVDDAEPGHSFLITREMMEAWEKKHRPFGPGDVVIFHSGFSDKYYRKLPEGERFVHTCLAGETPAWPAPDPACIEYLSGKGVVTAAIDSPSMGPVPDLAAASHVAGGKQGMIWTEGVIGASRLPVTGAFYAMLAPKYAGGSGGEARALAITEPKLASKLIESARAGRVVDLSVLLDENHPVTWPGTRPGSEATAFQSLTLHAFGNPRGPYFARAHILDGQAGTHLVPPAYSLPPAGFDDEQYAADVRRALGAYEAKFGKRGHSDRTVDRVPLDWLAGPAHVIDVKRLIGTTNEEEWPASPVITLEHVRRHEKDVGPIAAGDVVIFHSGYSDLHFQPFPAGSRAMADPLQGDAEGWPAPQPEVMVYLAEKGVRCVGTDGPTLGGVDPRQAMMVYWAAGSRDLCLVEYLTNIGKLPARGAHFLFAPIKQRGAHGGYGRAIALH